MKSKISFAIGLVTMVVVGLGGIKMLQFKTLAGTPWTQPPDTVSSAVAHEEHWQDTFEAVGSISAVQGVIVTPELAGTVSQIDMTGSTPKLVVGNMEISPSDIAAVGN